MKVSTTRTITLNGTTCVGGQFRDNVLDHVSQFDLVSFRIEKGDRPGDSDQVVITITSTGEDR